MISSRVGVSGLLTDLSSGVGDVGVRVQLHFPAEDPVGDLHPTTGGAGREGGTGLPDIVGVALGERAAEGESL